MPTLVIANKIYSSWSLRPWLLMRHLGVAFDEVLIPLDLPETKKQVLAYSPAGKVPVLIDGDVTIWETLAIMDYVGETFGVTVWPEDRKARAMARSVAAEMHAGFQHLRSACPMNLGKAYGPRDRGAGVVADVARFTQIVRQARERFGAGGAFLFGGFSAADAMFAPLVTRLDTYAIPLDADIRAYVDAILALPSFREWRKAALRETWIVAHDEVDEDATTNFRHVA
ncbi:glutathione S-transferase family protein [Microvirga antarctica]|uniref:glutathione S-transferase family protein n=1 Tax=Microvirga antarctica TaxID=2819233 RepID=UPI001B30F106|nr:glutathione S-transferase family protein [Microvirga antarctica]